MKKIMMGLVLSASVLGANTAAAETIREPIIPAIAGLQSKAILLGFAKNQYELGMAYYDGTLIPRDTAKAIEWLNRANAKGYAPAQVVLAKMNLTGDGVVANPQLAYQLLQQAAQKGNQDAINMLQQVQQQPTMSALDDQLLCKGWSHQTKKNAFFFIEDLIIGYDEMTSQTKSLKQSLLQSYTATIPYEDESGDSDPVAYVPKNPQAALFKKLETNNFYGYGYRYDAEFKAGVDLKKIVAYLEQRDAIKFQHYSQAQVQHYQNQYQQLDHMKNDTARVAAREKLNREYPLMQIALLSTPSEVYMGSVNIAGSSTEIIYMVIQDRSAEKGVTLTCGLGDLSHY